MVCIHFARKIIGGSLPGSAGASPASFVGVALTGSTSASPASFVGVASLGAPAPRPRSMPSLLSQRYGAGEAPALPGGGYADGVVQVERLRRKLWLERLKICFLQVARWCSIEKLRNLCLIMRMHLWFRSATSNGRKAGLRVGVTRSPA